MTLHGTTKPGRRALAGGLLAALLLAASAAPQERAPAQRPPAEESPGDAPETARDDAAEADASADETEAEPLPERKPDPRETEYFATCDHDANGWISFREMQISMSADRAEYQLYDTDRDGRVRPEEFVARFRLIIQRMGGFRPPTPYAASTPPSRRTPDELRNTYDADGSHALEATELEALLSDYRIASTEVGELLSLLDTDGSGALEMQREGEAVALSQWLEGAMSNQTWNRKAIQATTIDELFGEVTQREKNLGTSLLAPRIVGPVTHFRRLDLDGDGRISPDDLRALLAPARVQVQLGTVIASLDRDGDGLLGEAEFAAALGD